MASPSSVEDIPSPVDSPATPMPLNAALPVSQDNLQAMTNDSSRVGGLSGPLPTIESSMSQDTITPPLSSQQVNSRYAAVSPKSTPELSMLSSPPPTVVNSIKKENGSTISVANLTIDKISNASPEEILNVFRSLKAENQELSASVVEARMSAAHYKLQHNLLTIETEEAALRADVEHEMTRREVQALQRMVQGPESQAGREYITRLKTYCDSIQEKNVELQKRLLKAKKLIVERDDKISALEEEKTLLMDRVRANREHLNYLRSPGSIFHIATPKMTTSSYPATPQQQHRSTPKHTPMTGHMAARRDHSQEPFAALLLADRVLSQENNSAPSTPIVSRRADPYTPIRHNRGVQSLSSLPSTPQSSRPRNSSSTLLPSAPISEAQEKHTPNQRREYEDAQEYERRYKSRDSTISASDSEEIARANRAYYQENEEVQPSQASQSAREILRQDPRESFEVIASRSGSPKGGDKYQTTIMAPVSKRKREKDIYSDVAAKKMKMAETAPVGLGIGYENK